MESSQTQHPVPAARVRWSQRFRKWIARALLLYVGVLVVGLLPVNNHFRPTPDGVRIYLVSNAVHADLILPVRNESIDWSSQFSKTRFVGDVSGQTHVALGWGDKGFYLETQTWNDFKLSTAANALLLPSSSCLHVDYIHPQNYSDKVAITISQEQYTKLVAFIQETFARDSEGEIIQIQGYAYSTTDAFFEARGSYHLFNTCNSWIGRALKKAGVRTPWYSPMPKTPMLYLVSENDSPALEATPSHPRSTGNVTPY